MYLQYSEKRDKREKGGQPRGNFDYRREINKSRKLSFGANQSASGTHTLIDDSMCEPYKATREIIRGELAIT